MVRDSPRHERTGDGKGSVDSIIFNSLTGRKPDIKEEHPYRHLPENSQLAFEDVYVRISMGLADGLYHAVGTLFREMMEEDSDGYFSEAMMKLLDKKNVVDKIKSYVDPELKRLLETDFYKGLIGGKAKTAAKDALEKRMGEKEFRDYLDRLASDQIRALMATQAMRDVAIDALRKMIESDEQTGPFSTLFITKAEETLNRYLLKNGHEVVRGAFESYIESDRFKKLANNAYRDVLHSERVQTEARETFAAVADSEARAALRREAEKMLADPKFKEELEKILGKPLTRQEMEDYVREQLASAMPELPEGLLTLAEAAGLFAPKVYEHGDYPLKTDLYPTLQRMTRATQDLEEALREKTGRDDVRGIITEALETAAQEDKMLSKDMIAQLISTATKGLMSEEEVMGYLDLIVDDIEGLRERDHQLRGMILDEERSREAGDIQLYNTIGLLRTSLEDGSFLDEENRFYQRLEEKLGGTLGRKPEREEVIQLITRAFEAAGEGGRIVDRDMIALMINSDAAYRNHRDRLMADEDFLNAVRDGRLTSEQVRDYLLGNEGFMNAIRGLGVSEVRAREIFRELYEAAREDESAEELLGRHAAGPVAAGLDPAVLDQINRRFDEQRARMDEQGANYRQLRDSLDRHQRDNQADHDYINRDFGVHLGDPNAHGVGRVSDRLDDHVNNNAMHGAGAPAPGPGPVAPNPVPNPAPANPPANPPVNPPAPGPAPPGAPAPVNQQQPANQQNGIFRRIGRAIYNNPIRSAIGGLALLGGGLMLYSMAYLETVPQDVPLGRTYKFTRGNISPVDRDPRDLSYRHSWMIFEAEGPDGEMFEFCVPSGEKGTDYLERMLEGMKGKHLRVHRIRNSKKVKDNWGPFDDWRHSLYPSDFSVTGEGATVGGDPTDIPKEPMGSD